MSDRDGGRKSSVTTGSAHHNRSEGALSQGKLDPAKLDVRLFWFCGCYKGTKAEMVNTNQALLTPFVPCVQENLPQEFSSVAIVAGMSLDLRLQVESERLLVSFLLNTCESFM